MGKVVHRQPVWGWSVMLLSSLLLSPVAVTVLHALTQTIPYAAEAMSDAEPVPAEPADTHNEAVALVNIPRCTDDALSRALARGGRLFQIRIDTNPDGSIIAVYTHCAVCRIPDTDGVILRPVSDLLYLRLASLPASPRAPPV